MYLPEKLVAGPPQSGPQPPLKGTMKGSNRSGGSRFTCRTCAAPVHHRTLQYLDVLVITRKAHAEVSWNVTAHQNVILTSRFGRQQAAHGEA